MCFGVLAGAPFVMAQTPQTNVYFGLGTATADSNGQAIDTFGTGNFVNTPKMTGLFLNLGGSFMLTPHLGAGAEVNWRAGEGDYSGLNYRPIFYDFNGIWQPFSRKRFVPEVQAGIGGVRVGFSANTQQCDAFTGCSTESWVQKAQPLPGSLSRRGSPLCNPAYLPAAGRGRPLRG